MDLFSEILQPLMKYIAITFLATDVIKHVLRRVFKLDPARWSILIAIVLGVMLSYGWTLSVLPEPTRPGFEWVSVLLTGLIIAGGATGIFSWLKGLFPWYVQFNMRSKEECYNHAKKD